jgi:ABC-type transport system substrate-binding protein
MERSSGGIKDAILTKGNDGYVGALCGSEEIDSLLAKGRSETAPAARHAIYRAIEEILARESLLLPLFHEQTYRFGRPEVDGLSLNYGAAAVNYAHLQIRG